MILVLQGLGPYAMCQLRSTFKGDDSAGLQDWFVKARELHAVSSGSIVVAVCIALEAKLLSPGECVAKHAFGGQLCGLCAPYSFAAMTAEWRRAAAELGRRGEALLDEAVGRREVYVYYHEASSSGTLKRVCARPRTWRDLVECTLRSSRIPLLSPPDPRYSPCFDGVRVFPEDVEPRRLQLAEARREEVVVVDASPLWVCLLFPLYDAPAVTRFRPKLQRRSQSSWLERRVASALLCGWMRFLAHRPARERRLRRGLLAVNAVALLWALARLWRGDRRVARTCWAGATLQLLSHWARRRAGETWELRDAL